MTTTIAGLIMNKMARHIIAHRDPECATLTAELSAEDGAYVQRLLGTALDQPQFKHVSADDLIAHALRLGLVTLLGSLKK